MCYNQLMHKRYWAAILTLSTSVFCCGNTFATNPSTSTFTVDVNQVVLELTIPTDPAVINLNPTASGTAFGTANLNIKVATNNVTGYTLTMSPTNAVDNSALIRTELIGDEQEYRKINSLVLNENGYSEQDFTSDSWGYKIVGDNYFGISPSLPVLSPAWITEGPTNGDTTTLTLAAKVGASTISGAYETTLNFQAVTNSTLAKHTIHFNANGGTGSMQNMIVLVGDTATIPENTFTAPTGKKFIGWSTEQNGLGGRVYADGATYVPEDSGYNRSIELYAIWADENFPTSSNGSSAAGTTSLQRAYEIAYTAAGKGMYIPDGNAYREATSPEDYNGIASSEYRFLIQDISTELCASVTETNSMAQVLDIRDYSSYWIGKTLDNRCWMLDNLTLNPTDSAVKTRLSSSNTNATDAAIRNFTGAQSTSKSGWTTTPVYSGSAYTYTDPVVYLTGKDDVAIDALSQEHGWKNGAWYTLCATSVGTYCYPERQYVWDVNDAFTIKEDICPANWRLPTGNLTQDTVHGDELHKMYSPFTDAINAQTYSFRLVHRIPFSTAPGFVQGSSVTYWSSTICREGCNSAMSISDGAINWTLPLVSSFQMSVRCIAK